MRRREFVAGVVALAVANRPFRAHAQQAARRPRVGVLIYSTPDQDPNTRAFLEGLRQLGYVDGQNVTFEYLAGAAS
jgi:putative ABC transport system substrate-binding protein